MKSVVPAHPHHISNGHPITNAQQVENPIPFIPSRLARVLTTLYLHALYARQLILPVQVTRRRAGLVQMKFGGVWQQHILPLHAWWQV